MPGSLKINPATTEAILHTFLEMVRIDSPSGHEEPLRVYLRHRLAEMHISSWVDSGGNLIAEIPKNHCPHEKILVLSGHMDVVPPCIGIKPRIEGKKPADWETGRSSTAEHEPDLRYVTSDNTTVLGADDKAGLASILEVLALSLKENLPRPTIRLIFTTREETSLGGAKELCDESLKANFAIVFDHTGPQGTIIHQAPYYYHFTVTCYGKSVHAGIMPEKGINAIVFASRIIDRLHLGRIDAETTCNIGFIQGGKATNVVPDEATFQGELRGHSQEKLASELAYIREVLETEKQRFPGADYSFEAVEEFKGYCLDPDLPAVGLVLRAAEKTGLTPQLIQTNGGSDNNVFVARGLPGVVLSAGYIDPHSIKERVYVKEMQQCAAFLVNIMEQFANHEF